MQCFQDTSIMIQTTTLLLDFIFRVMVGRMVRASLGSSGWYTLNKLKRATKETLNCTDQLAKLATRLTGLLTNWDSTSEADSETFCLSVWWWDVCQLCLFALILTESLLQWKKSFTVLDSRNNCIRLKTINHIKKKLKWTKALRSLTKPKMKTDTSCLFT